MIKNLLDADEEAKKKPDRPSSYDKPSVINALNLFDSRSDSSSESDQDTPFVLSTAEPESYGDTIRNSGLAWSAGIAFFASVAFMLVLGWGADLLLGTSPWGIVGGIIIGSVIGFIQFFRLTSQIFKK